MLIFLLPFIGDVRLIPNVALRRRATQNPHSDYVKRTTDGQFGSLYTTISNTEPVWWQVDLLEMYEITKVAIRAGAGYYRMYLLNFLK